MSLFSRRIDSPKCWKQASYTEQTDSQPNLLLRKIRTESEEGREAGNCFLGTMPIALLATRERERERELDGGGRAGRPINQFWLRETIKRMIHLQKREAVSRIPHKIYPYFKLDPNYTRITYEVSDCLSYEI